MSDEQPWQTKSQIMVTLGKSSRTIDLYVRSGKVERMQDGSRAFFRLADARNPVTTTQPAQSTPDLVATLTEMRDELRALRAEVAALRGSLPPAQLPAVTASETMPQDEAGHGNAVTQRNPKQRRSWIRRFLYGPT